MIESSSRIIKVLQISKPVTLLVPYLLFALLFFYSSAGVFIDNASTNHGYGASGNGSKILMQNSALNVTAHIIPYDAKPYPHDAIGTYTYATDNPLDLVHKAHADGKHAGSIALSPEKGADRSSLARNMVSFVMTWGDEGMHINWSPLSSFFEPRFISMMTDFSSALARILPKPLLTTAATWGVFTVRPAVELLYMHQNSNTMTTYEISAPLSGPIVCRDDSSL